MTVIEVLPGESEQMNLRDHYRLFPEMRFGYCPLCRKEIVAIDLGQCQPVRLGSKKAFINSCGITFVIKKPEKTSGCSHSILQVLKGRRIERIRRSAPGPSVRKDLPLAFVTVSSFDKELRLRVRIDPEGRGMLSDHQVRRLREEFQTDPARIKGLYGAKIEKTREGYLIATRQEHLRSDTL